MKRKTSLLILLILSTIQMAVFFWSVFSNQNINTIIISGISWLYIEIVLFKSEIRNKIDNIFKDTDE